MYKEIITPISRYDYWRVLGENKITQTELAQEYGCTQGAVSRFVNAQSPSQPFWDWFFNRFPEARQYERAS